MFIIRADGAGLKIFDVHGNDLLAGSNLNILNKEIEIIEEEKPIEKISEIKKTLDIAFSNLEDALDKINRLENELEKENE